MPAFHRSWIGLSWHGITYPAALAQYISHVDSSNCTYRTHTLMSTSLTAGKARRPFPNPGSPPSLQIRMPSNFSIYLSNYYLSHCTVLFGRYWWRSTRVNIGSHSKAIWTLSDVSRRPWKGASWSPCPPTVIDLPFSSDLIHVIWPH